MRYIALAVDYDGTLASQGRVRAETVLALERLAATGRKLVLVTGRRIEELLPLFPEVAVFDRVVAENGALLYVPATKEHTLLGDPPPAAFVQELVRRGVAPLEIGRSIVATVHPQETTVLEVIRDLGIELQVIFNKAAVMVLPASVNKASGLTACLHGLGLSLHNVVAIGDAENDYAMLRAAEYGVAVANAVPMLRREADWSSARENGDAVAELVEALVRDDLRTYPRRVARRPILLGTRVDRTPLEIEPASPGLLIAGSSASANAAFAAGVLEQLAEAKYQCCVIDPEGVYDGNLDAIMLGGPEGEVSIEAVATALHSPDPNVLVNLAGLPRRARASLCSRLILRLLELRRETGRPHWILVDRADQVLSQSGEFSGERAYGATGMLYVTEHPERVAPGLVASVDLVVALGDEPTTTLARVAGSVGRPAPPPVAHRCGPGEALAWYCAQPGPPFRMKLAAR